MYRSVDCSVASDTDYATSSSGVFDSDFSDNYSEGTLSRCNSLERLKLIEGYVEENFRVDRKKLESMILGCPPDPWDTEVMKIPIDEDGRVKSANDFFGEIMAATKTIIKFPKYLKLGARNKKDPHVRVIGHPDAVRDAVQRIRYELQPHNKITMKLDVSWTCHSHIIGKGGNTIQPVVKRTGVSIHFPDGNKNSEIHKSNQVSINSRGEEISGLEDARSAIRGLTPLVFTFLLPAKADFLIHVDISMIISDVTNTYNVQAEVQLFSEETLFGSVKGTEGDAVRVKEATLWILHALCGSLANQMTVQMTLEISPQHHSFILGRNAEGIRKIMQRTATRITFPDANDPLLPPLSRSTIKISGAIENVYLARQNLIGSLPLVLMFDLPAELTLNQHEANQIMQTLDVFIVDRSKRVDGRRSVVIKGAERNASNIYEAWRLVTKSGKSVPKAKIPPSYHSSEVIRCSLNECLLGGPVICSYPSIQYENYYSNSSDTLSYCRELQCSNSMSSGDSSCCFNTGSTESNDSSIAASTQDLNNNVVKNELSTSSLSGSFTSQPLSNDSTTTSCQLDDIDYLFDLILDRRAPGCEKKQNAMADYISKKFLALKAMKEPVNPKPRVPTSAWSGYGFSKSEKPFPIKELIKQEKRNQIMKEEDIAPFQVTESNSYGLGSVMAKRKTFDTTVSNMDSILRRPLYKNSLMVNNLGSLLVYINMDQYIDLFATFDVDYDKFLTLSDQDLKDLGVFSSAHRNKLLMTIKELSLESVTMNKRI